MFRKLSAIEIAEAALLADIAVVIQVIVIFLPAGGSLVSLLVPVVFAVLVLRRGFYVGLLCLCVTFCLLALLTGPGSLVIMVPESGAGLFLGLTMRHRLRHLAIFLLGVTSGALTLYCLFLMLTLLSGLPPSRLIQGVYRTYLALVPVIGVFTSSIGLGEWWTQSVYPTINQLVQLGLIYWWAFFYVALWIILCPVVVLVYYITNAFVRLLGYDVRPFPGGKIERIVRKAGRTIIRLGLKRGVLRRRVARA
jgi:uncharacterized protein YybS (DUF2232 family)